MKYGVEYKRGQLINGLTYLNDIEQRYSNVRFALFKCKCGNLFNARISHVKSKHTKSCGCKKRDLIKIARTTHGDCNNNPLHILWTSIKARCFNEKTTSYKNYGGRGITMYKYWVNNYPRFRDYIILHLGNKPNGYSIDRIDNEKGYVPTNLRWANHITQMNNTRRQKKNERRKR